MDVAINYSIEEIAQIINARVSGINHSPSDTSLHILLDSRKLIFPGLTVFFDLNKNKSKSYRYIKELYDKGVRYFVSSEMHFDMPGAVFLVVDHVLEALQKLASHHRGRFTQPVIGITGSNGKTIVKEWLYHLLENDHKIVRSPKSYNSQIGVPLSVLQTGSENDLAIFEAGISQPGEMERLEKMIRPTIGVFTNIGDTHSEGFENKVQKIKEKLFLFKQARCVIYCKDDEDVETAMRDLHNDHGIQLFNWSRKSNATLNIQSIEKNDYQTTIKGTYFGEIIISIPFTDEASIENAITCLCVLLYMKVSREIIFSRMLTLHSVEMRLQLKQGINNCSLINDSYSSDITSLKIALDFLQQQKQHSKQTVILSDILQSAKDDEDLYSEVASLLSQKNIDRLIAIGPKIYSRQDQFSFLPEKHFFNSVEECMAQFSGMPGGNIFFKDETILLKGARAFQFEQIDHILEQKAHQTVLSINLTSIVHNCKFYQGLLRPGVRIMAMVKAFSYGSGSYEIANLLQFNNVDYLAVAYVDEGVELRKAGITMPVMVMNPEENSFNLMAAYNLEPEIFSFGILSSFQKYIQSTGTAFFPVHIKLDTGMHRLGFEEKDIEELVKILAGNETLKIQSVFSHLVAAEDEQHDDFTTHQAGLFLRCCERLQAVVSYNFTRHIANTSAISRHHSLQLDMVRLGIGLYGIDSNSSVQKKLKNVSTLSTTIAQVKKVKAGESVGYGCNSFLTRDSTIATVRIGYADGYPRSLSNGKGKMMINDKLYPVAGNICMDMTMLDVTGSECKEGDNVIVFSEKLPIQQVAEWADTIPYEIMTGVSQRVKRVYYEE